MSALDTLVSELNGALAEEYRHLKSSLSDMKRRTAEYETTLGAKDDAILTLHAEQKRLTQELDDLQRTTVHLKSILDDLQVAAVKTKNASRQTRKAVKRTDCLFELNTQLTQKDREVLLKRRLSLYIVKKFLGIHIEQGPGNDINIISWSDDSPIQTTCVNSPEQSSDLAPILWESLSMKSAHYDKWDKLFEKNRVDSEM